MEASVAKKTINLLLIDDHAMFRQGLARLFEKEPEFKIVGQHTTVSDALLSLRSVSATMILLDVDLGSERAVDFIIEARKIGFDGKILVVTAGASEQEAIQLLEAGVAGILHKHHSADVLSSTIRKVAGGEVYLEKEYMTPLFRTVDRTNPPLRPILNDRDKKVLRFVFQGLTNRQIGARLEISESAVKSSLRQLFEKLSVRTRSQLVKVAIEQYHDQL